MTEWGNYRWIPAPEGVACACLALEEISAGVPTDGPPCAPLAAMLSDEEFAHFARLRIRKRRVEWLAGRIAAKLALQRLHGCELPRGATVRQDANGRPTLSGTRLSISHSSREAMAAASHVPVGVDTETFDATRAESMSALVRPAEAQALRLGLGCDTQVARTVAWCLKEALFKAAGSGAFHPFAEALQLLGWCDGLTRPSWHWASNGRPLDAPQPQAWQARFGIGQGSAWVMVASSGVACGPALSASPEHDAHRDMKERG